METRQVVLLETRFSSHFMFSFFLFRALCCHIRLRAIRARVEYSWCRTVYSLYTQRPASNFDPSESYSPHRFFYSSFPLLLFLLLLLLLILPSFFLFLLPFSVRPCKPLLCFHSSKRTTHFVLEQLKRGR